MKKTITFGEIMLRLSPPGYARFTQAETFRAFYGGGEANVAASLASFGMESVFVSKLPVHEIGQAALNSLRRWGVDTSRILRGGSRLGIYYCESGASQRPSKVIYDRAGSAVSQADPAEYDWSEILSDADWFHFTGITPAISENAARACLDAVRKCREMGVTVSCDLNYRKNLWSREDACKVMSGFMPYVDVCIANEEDAADVFGIRAEGSDAAAGVLNRGAYAGVADKLTEKFGFKKVAVTLRESFSANDNRWAAMLYDGGKAYYSRSYDVHIVDRIGGGDSFCAGLIYALQNRRNPQSAVDFAVAASCLKHSVEGDINLISVPEAEALAAGDASGRVKR